jgi:glycosyltransferase involved in cell wall biosynthesis
VHVIPNGIDTEHFKPDTARGRRLRESLGWCNARIVVSSSRLHRQKGVHLGLEAFAQLEKKRNEVRYLIVGGGPELAALQEQAKELGIDHKVHFVGAVSRDQLPSYLQAADTMLFTTTRVEGLPLNVLEALAVGIPAVVSKHLFRDDSLSNSPCIHRVDQRDPGAVADALELALEVPCSTQCALPREYSLAECARTYLDLFEKISEQKAVSKIANLPRV